MHPTRNTPPNAAPPAQPTRVIRRTPRLQIPFGAPVRFSGAPITWDNKIAVNGHMLIAGPSGTGKSYQLDRVVDSLATQGASRIYVVNVHGDLCAELPHTKCHTIRFHEQSGYGLPPLDVLEDPEIGGVRRRANAFIELLARQGALGPKQKTALFRLLEEVYRRFGFYMDDARTWRLDYDPRGWARVQKRYPTLRDVKDALWERLLMMKIGAATEYIDEGRGQKARLPSEAIRSFEAVIKLAAQRSRMRSKLQRIRGGEETAAKTEIEKLEAKLADTREKAFEAMKQAMVRLDDATVSGEEFKEFLLWDNADAVKSLYDRLEALERAGIFQGSPPPFRPDIPVWNYDIKALTDNEQQLFVEILLERIYTDAKRRGEADGADTFIVLDEAHKFVVDEGDHIINRIVKEARKFGVGLIMASQAFIHFSDDLNMSASLKLVLGCPEIYREPMRRKLGLDMVEIKGRKYNPLSFIRPQQTALASISNKGESRPMVEIGIRNPT